MHASKHIWWIITVVKLQIFKSVYSRVLRKRNCFNWVRKRVTFWLLWWNWTTFLNWNLKAIFFKLSFAVVSSNRVRLWWIYCRSPCQESWIWSFQPFTSFKISWKEKSTKSDLKSLERSRKQWSEGKKVLFRITFEFRSLHPLLKSHYNDLKRLNLMVRCTKFNTSTQNSKTSQIVTINQKEIKVEETVRSKKTHFIFNIKKKKHFKEKASNSTTGRRLLRGA